MPPLQKQPRCGAADASSRGGIAKGFTGSISGGVSQKLQRAKETAAGKGALADEEMTPQKLRRGGEKAGTVSRSGEMTPSRLPSTTVTLTQTRAGEKNIQSKTSTLDRDISCRFEALDINNAANASASASMDGTTAQDLRESVPKNCAEEKAGTSSIGKILPKHRAKEVGLSGKIPAKEKMSKGSSGEMPQKHQAKQETVTQLVTTREKHTKRNKPLPRNSSDRTAGHQLRTTCSSQCLDAKAGHSLDGKSTSDNCKESAADKNTIVHVVEDKGLQEANDEIQRLNELGLGEDISSDEFLQYFEQLPTKPAVDTYTKLDDEKLTPLYECHARYRIRYLKSSQMESKEKLNAELKQHNAMDLLDEDLSGMLLAKMRYFEHFEEDGTLDWFFHPDLCRLEALDDYQRLVPRNHGGCEYANWDKYHKFFYSYEIEQEYINYSKELSKKLKWMKDYVLIDKTSLKWGKISTRGAYQAIKIATGFSKITVELAYTGYYECVDSLRLDVFWLDYLDGVYFEIWLRVTKQMKSFRDALEEVYKLEMFPVRHERMKYALDNDCSDMEMEFHTCTASVTSEVTEDKARELIAEAVKKMDRPKPYEQYIRKKIAIAQAIGLIPTVIKQASAESGQVHV